MTALVGVPAGQAFSRPWQDHVNRLGDYTAALRVRDTARRDAARAGYLGAESRLTEAFVVLVGGTVSGPALAAAASAHGEHLLGHAGALASGDHNRAYAVQREAFGHMIAVADVLARGVATGKQLPTTELDTPRRALQSALSRLLAEHEGLMVQVMRAAHDGAPAAAGDALNANTTELGAAISTLFGAPAAQQFLALRAPHVEGLILHASSPGDRAAQSRARAGQ